jgi:hypothetical protein
LNLKNQLKACYPLMSPFELIYLCFNLPMFYEPQFFICFLFSQRLGEHMWYLYGFMVEQIEKKMVMWWSFVLNLSMISFNQIKCKKKTKTWWWQMTINYSLCDFDENILWKFEILKKKTKYFCFHDDKFMCFDAYILLS